MPRPNKNWREVFEAIDAARWGDSLNFLCYQSFHAALLEYAKENDLEISQVMRNAIAKSIGWKGPVNHPSDEEAGYTLIDLTIDEVAWIRYLKRWQWSPSQISRKLRLDVKKVYKMLLRDPDNRKIMKYFPAIPVGGEKPPWYVAET